VSEKKKGKKLIVEPPLPGIENSKEKNTWEAKTTALAIQKGKIQFPRP